MEIKSSDGMNELCEISHLLYNKNLICSSGGNVSVREGDKVYITATGATLGQLQPSDVVTVDYTTGKVLQGGIPSKELGFHLSILRSNSEIHGVIHVHPTASVAFSAQNPTAKLNAVPATNAGYYVRSGQIPMLPYFPSGSKALHEAVDYLASDFNTILLRLHGLIVGRKTLLEAFNATEEIEQNCQIYFLSGEKAHFLTQDQCDAIDKALGRSWPSPEKYTDFFSKF